MKQYNSTLPSLIWCLASSRVLVSCIITGLGSWVSCTITGLGVLHHHGFGCPAPSRVWVSCTVTGLGVLHHHGFGCLAPSRVFGVLHHHGVVVSCTITGFGCLVPSRVWVSCTITGLGVLHQLGCKRVPWWALNISVTAHVLYIILSMKLLGTGACETSL